MIMWPLIVAALFVVGFLIWLVWLPEPPDHDPDTCDECKWR